MSTPLKELEKTARALSLIAEGMDLQNHLSEENGRLKQELAEAQEENNRLNQELAEAQAELSAFYPLEYIVESRAFYRLTVKVSELFAPMQGVAPQHFVSVVAHMSEGMSQPIQTNIDQALGLLYSIVESLIAINSENQNEISIQDHIFDFNRYEASLKTLLGDYWTYTIRPQLVLSGSRAEELLSLDPGNEK